MTLPSPSVGDNRNSGIARRFWGLFLVAVVTTLVCALQPYDNGPPIRSDGVGYHAWTYAILRGDLNFIGQANETYAFHETRPGHWANVYPPGVALARLPVMAFCVDLGPGFGRPTLAEHVACVVLSGLALAIAACLLFYSCRATGASHSAANVTVVAVVFGTGLFHYATYDASYSHVWSALGIAALVALAARSRDPRARFAAVGLGAIGCWLILVRNTNLFAIAILGASYFLLAPKYLGLSRQIAFRNTLGLLGGTALGVAIQIALNTYAHGRVTLSSYEGTLFVWDRPMQWSVLTSLPEHGLFVYYPVAFLFLVVPFAVRRLWLPALVFVVLVGAYTTLYGYWNMWNLGASFGHRGFVEILPAGAPLFAAALTRLPRWPRRAVFCATLLCVYVTINLMAGYWRRTLPYHEITAEMYRDHVIGREMLLTKRP
jgi:hypothetical protein